MQFFAFYADPDVIMTQIHDLFLTFMFTECFVITPKYYFWQPMLRVWAVVSYSDTKTVLNDFLFHFYVRI